MKNDLVDVSDTEKHLTIEIPSAVVDAQIDRVARGLARSARIPGFRPGKVPTGVVKQRFRDQILQEVARDLVPRAIGEVLQERGLEPVDEPDVKDFAIDPGQPLKFSATFATLPDFDPGDLAGLVVRQPPADLAADAVDRALQRLRERAARFEPVEDRPVADGDSVVLDIVRTAAGGTTDTHEKVPVTIGGEANPPGFDANLIGLAAGARQAFTVHFADDYAVPDMAGTDVAYDVTVREIRRRVLPDVDDDFAKDLKLETLADLRTRVETDLRREAEHASRRDVRRDLLAQLARRVPYELPAALVDRELDRRVEEVARRLMEQGVDPRQAGLDWGELREGQREDARNSVAGALVLDLVAKREQLTATPDAIDREIEQMATRVNRTPAAVRAQIEKDGGMVRLAGALRREMALEHVLGLVTVVRA
ncbi:MAG: trigger factor [Acidimicrobiia bacterium]|nr:trigger factor [Acidimicrobiia bacterium]